MRSAKVHHIHLFHAGKHLDGKNTPGSYSALVVLETGAVPFAGGFYMLPQYHKALDIRQGAFSPWNQTSLSMMHVDKMWYYTGC